MPFTNYFINCGLALGALCLVQLPAQAQVPTARWQIGLQTGPGLSYNHTEARPTLPGGVRTYNALSFAFHGTLAYRFNEHYALEGAAGWYLTHDGLRYGELTYGYAPDGSPTYVSGSYLTAYPIRELRLHALRYFPIGHGRLSAYVGAGPSFVWGRFDEYEGFSTIFQEGSPQGEEILFYTIKPTMRRSGWLLGVQAGLALRLSQRGSLRLAAQYHQGLRTIYAAETTEFVYTMQQQVQPGSYHAVFSNRGSYGVLTLGYQYQLGRQR